MRLAALFRASWAIQCACASSSAKPLARSLLDVNGGSLPRYGWKPWLMKNGDRPVADESRLLMANSANASLSAGIPHKARGIVPPLGSFAQPGHWSAGDMLLMGHPPCREASKVL